MLVPHNYLPFEFKENDKIINDWKKLIRSSEFTLGTYVDRFENAFAKFIGTKYCISTNSGTDALILCLKSLGIKKDDEIITVSNTFYATAGAIVACGAIPVFVDCDSRYQIDEKLIEKAITKKTKVIMPVHWGGSSPNMQAISKLAKKRKIHIIEDTCMGIGAKLENKRAGTFGICSAYSMHPLKSLNVMGDGGMITTNNKTIAHWMYKYRNHGMINRNNIEFWGVNMRLQPLQAVVALHNLKKINSVIKKRNLNAKILDIGLCELNPRIILPTRNKNNIETYALYMILVEKRDQLLKYLNQNRIEAKIHYPKPLHLQNASKIFNYKKGDFPISEMQANKLITIPVHQFLSKKQIHFTIKKIKDFYKK